MREKVIVWSVFVVIALAGSAWAQGNSGCDGTIQGGGDEAACNRYGLCRAYFAGSDNGREHKRQAGPFVALVEAACNAQENMCGEGQCECGDPNNDSDDSCQDTPEECVMAFCAIGNPSGKHDDKPANRGNPNNPNQTN